MGRSILAVLLTTIVHEQGEVGRRDTESTRVVLSRSNCSNVTEVKSRLWLRGATVSINDRTLEALLNHLQD